MAMIRMSLLMMCVASTLLLAGNAFWIETKAWLAQQLISHAWQRTLTEGAPQRPWSWADTWPVAKLTLNEQTLYVLDSTSGQALAFGPGLVASDHRAPLHQFNQFNQGTMIAGHKDTHFRMLEYLQVDDVLTLETMLGEQERYRITHSRTADSRTDSLFPPRSADQLVLISCYPFNQAAGGPLRYLVYAQRVLDTGTTAGQRADRHRQPEPEFVNPVQGRYTDLNNANNNAQNNAQNNADNHYIL